MQACKRLGRQFLVLVMLLVVGLSAVAKRPCYPDAQQAYEHLMSERQQRASGKININTAGIERLINLKGIGHSTATAIVSYRQTHGEFKSVDDLSKVKGVGQATIDKNRHRLVVFE